MAVDNEFVKDWLYSRTAEKGCSRKLGFWHAVFSETGLPVETV
jgi:hypothetical protein